MDVYEQVLPGAFPWVYMAPREEIKRYVEEIMTRRDTPSEASSFAVDVVHVDNWRLWMSDASYGWIQSHHNITAAHNDQWPERRF